MRKSIFNQDIENDDISTLKEYIELLDQKAKKPQKLEFIKAHTTINWSNIEANKDGTYSKTNVNKYIATLQAEFDFVEESFEAKLKQVNQLLEEETVLKKQVKEATEKLHLNTKKAIENLTDEQVCELLQLKWIAPLVETLYSLPIKIVDELTSKLQKLAQKYAITLKDVENDITKTAIELAEMVDDLDGHDFDMQGLEAFKELLV